MRRSYAPYARITECEATADAPQCVNCECTINRTRDVQEWTGDWWCQDCHDGAAQQQAEDKAAGPPPTMDELHRAAWLAKERAR